MTVMNLLYVSKLLLLKNNRLGQEIKTVFLRSLILKKEAKNEKKSILLLA